MPAQLNKVLESCLERIEHINNLLSFENKDENIPFLRRAIVNEISQLGEALTYLRPSLNNENEVTLEAIFKRATEQNTVLEQIEHFNQLAQETSTYFNMGIQEEESPTPFDWLIYYINKSVPIQAEYCRRTYGDTADLAKEEKWRTSYIEQLANLTPEVQGLYKQYDDKQIDEEQYLQHYSKVYEQKKLVYQKYILELNMEHMNKQYYQAEELYNPIIREARLLQPLHDAKNTENTSLITGFTKYRNQLKHLYPIERSIGKEGLYENARDYFKNNHEKLGNILKDIYKKVSEDDIEIEQKSGAKPQFQESGQIPKNDISILENICEAISRIINEINDLEAELKKESIDIAKVSREEIDALLRKTAHYQSGIDNYLESIYYFEGKYKDILEESFEAKESASPVRYGDVDSDDEDESLDSFSLLMQEEEALYDMLDNDTKKYYENFNTKRREIAHNKEEKYDSELPLSQQLYKNFMYLVSLRDTYFIPLNNKAKELMLTYNQRLDDKKDEIRDTLPQNPTQLDEDKNKKRKVSSDTLIPAGHTEESEFKKKKVNTPPNTYQTMGDTASSSAFKSSSSQQSEDANQQTVPKEAGSLKNT